MPSSDASPGGIAGRSSNTRRDLVFGELLDKATALFAEKGYEATSLQDIASAVGISRPALYHYVSSKEDLLTALVHQVSEAVDEAITSVAHRTDLSATEKLRQFTQVLIRQRSVSPEQFRILDRADAVLPEQIRNKHLQARRHMLTELTTVIDDGMAQGEFKAVDPGLAALGVLGMCNWVAWWSRPGRGYEVDAVVTQLSQAAVDTVALPPTRRRSGPDSPGAALERARQALDAVEALLPRPPSTG